jgi:5-bromo-4-chloroindolyl phosphate hydrolysis protein
MNPFISFLVGLFVILPLTITVWLLSYIAYDQTLLLSTVISLSGGFFTYKLISMYARSKFLKKHALTRKEFRYIKKNLGEADRKISRLNKAFLQIREIPSLKQRIDVVRITRRIYKLAKKEPRRFYDAEQFFFSHLDSVVELTEKYALLSSQPNKTLEIEHSLRETRSTLNELTRAVESDLHEMLSDDLDRLNYEIDVAKHSLKIDKDSKMLEDNWRLKK